MIVYFDTSALVATYVADDCTPLAMKARAEASGLATSLLAYAETLAAFGAMARTNALTRARRDKIESRFLADWPDFHRVRVERRLLPDVRQILQRHALKGADAVHLASACLVARGCSTAGLEARFACDDRALAAAAVGEGLTLAW
jgi:predicted nucleic acid-binding protein